MALVDNAWYVNSVTYGTVTAWVAATSLFNRESGKASSTFYIDPNPVIT